MFTKVFRSILAISILNISLAAIARVEEGKSVGVYPGATDCCKGLELQPPAPGIYGSAGTCVESRNPPSKEVNGSRIQSKDSVPGIINSPSPGSSANKQ